MYEKDIYFEQLKISIDEYRSGVPLLPLRILFMRRSSNTWPHKNIQFPCSTIHVVNLVGQNHQPTLIRVQANAMPDPKIIALEVIVSLGDNPDGPNPQKSLLLSYH